jgi:hypothetical protein
MNGRFGRLTHRAACIGGVTSTAFLIACSSASPEANTASQSQPINCASSNGDLRLADGDSCGDPGPIGTVKKPSPPPLVCTMSTTCGSEALSAFDPVRMPNTPSDAQNGFCHGDSSLSDQLTAMGCVSPQYYAAGAAINNREAFYIGWCPHTPTEATDVPWVNLDGCNECTGPQPEPGWVLLGWAGTTNCGQQPGSGCHSVTCLSLIPPGP